MCSLRRKAIPTFEGKNHANKNSYGNELPQNLPEDSESFSKRIKQELISLASPLHEAESSNPGLSQLFPVDSHITAVEAQKAKSKRKVRSEASSKSRKKNQFSSNILDEEQIDKDLLGLVGIINTDKNLNSDSSGDTIILDDTNSSSPHKDTQNNNSNEERTTFSQPFTFDMFPFSNFSNKNEEEKLSKSGMLENVSLNTNKSFALESQLSKSQLGKKTVNKNEEKSKIFSELNSSSSVLRETLLKSSKVPSELCTTSFNQHTLSNFAMTENSSGVTNKSPLGKGPRKRRKKNLIPISLTVLKSLGQMQPSPSDYASMGIDEDLCDVEDKPARTTYTKLNITSKQPCGSLNEVNNLRDVPIKTEPDESSLNAYNDNETNKSFFDKSGNCVFMTFEAEPVCEEEEEDDDNLPLSFLRNRTSEPKHDVHNTISNSTTDIHPSCFIKKELIEDDIVSESQAVSVKSLVSDSKTTENSHSQSSSKTPYFDLMGVKIKTEPPDNESYSDSVVTNSCPVTHSNDANSIKSSEGNTKGNSILENFVNVNLPKPNNVCTNLHLNTSSQYVNKVNSNNISCDSDINAKNSVSKEFHKRDLHFQNMNKNSEFQKVEILNQSTTSVFNSPKATKNVTSKTNKSNKKKTNINIQSVSKNNNIILPDFSEKNVNLEVSNDNMDSDILDSGIENNINSPKNGRKRKKIGRKLDENAPITLLIKKKKTNSVESGASDSFHCTDISSKPMSAHNESNSSYCSSENASVEFNESPVIKETQKGISSAKRKQTKKQNKIKRTLSTSQSNDEAVQSEPRLVPSLKIPLKSNNTYNFNSNISENLDVSSNKSKISECLPNCSYSDTNIIKQGDYVAYMDFQEELPEEHPDPTICIKKENDLPDINDKQLSDSSNSISVIKNIKKEKVSPLHSVEYSNILSYDNHRLTPLSHDSQVEESMSTISSITSSSVAEDMSCKSTDSPLKLDAKAVSKKKKKRARSNGWYKKKKSKAKEKQVNTWSIQETVQESTIEINTPQEKSKAKGKSQAETLQQSTTEINVHDNIVAASKVPVVVIKNLSTEKIMQNASDKISNSLNSKQELVKPPSSKKKRGKTSRKRKKSSPRIKTNVPNSESLLIDNESKCNEEGENDNIKDLENDSSKFSEKHNSEIQSVGEKVSEYNLCTLASENIAVQPVEHMSIDDQPNIEKKDSITEDTSDQSNNVASKNKKIFPSLNVEEFAQDIATFEAILLNNKSNNSSEKIQNLNVENVKEPNPQYGNVGITKELECTLQTFSKEIDKSKNSSIVSSASKPLSTDFCSTSSSPMLNISFDSIQIKKEMGDCAEMSINLLNEKLPTSLNEKSFVETVASDNSFGNLTFIKKEKTTEESSIYKSNFTASNTDKSLSVLSTENRQKDATIPADSLADTNPLLQCNVFQNSQPADINSIGISIKKEVCDVVKSGTNINYTIKDQNDLIQKVCRPNLRISNSERSSAHSSVVHSNSFVSSPNNKDLNEEIQVLSMEQKSDMNVVCVDLTDDCPSVQETVNDIPQFDTIKKLTTQLVKQNKLVPQNMNLKTSSPIIPGTCTALKDNSSFSLQKSNELPSQLESFKANIPTKDCINKRTVDSDMIKAIKTPTTVRKYHEYFTHPFPPSVVLCNKKQRNRDDVYTRTNSKSWNLSIKEVESRLKHSNTGPQFGDIIKLEKYLVSFAEVECYHRILGVAPSHKLLSKCFLSPDKKYGTKIRNEFENSFNLCQPRNMDNSFNLCEPRNMDDKVMKDINALIQGIAETKMEFSDSVKSNSSFYDRDCPSTDTRDSFDSHISNLSDKSFVPTQSKDITNLKSVLTIDENELVSVSKDASSVSQNSVLPCASSNSQDLSRNGLHNIDFSNIKNSDLQFIKTLNFNETKLLTDSTFPHKQVVECSVPNNTVECIVPNNTVDCTVPNSIENQSYVETSNTSFCSLTESRNDVKLPTDQNVQVEPVMVSSINTNDEFKPSLNINNKILDALNLPVSELRKILETASSVGLDARKSKATFEYNHTQSTPVVEANSDYKTGNVDSSRSIPSDLSPLDNKPTECLESENSDDNYVENEPIHREESDIEDSTSCTNAEECEKPAEIPQYKSKWEKIMERKSQELKEKEKINEHFLKDCFPVSTAVKKQNKRNSSFDEPTPKSNVKEPENLNRKECPNKSTEGINQQKNKSTAGKNTKQKNCEHKLDTNIEKPKNSTKSSKKKRKRKIETNEKDPKKKALNNTDGTVDASNLFVPDKLVKAPCNKNNIANKSSEKEKSKRFYGNRVTNRGTFLTETKLPEVMKRIPKKKTPEIKKAANLQTDDFYSKIKLPDINIGSSFKSKYKNANKAFDSRKNSEFYKSPLSDNTPSTSHFIRTKKMRDRQLAYMNPQFPNKSMQNKRTSFFNKPIEPYQAEYEETSRKVPLLSTPPGRNMPLLNTPSLIASHTNVESMNGRRVPLLSTQSSIPSHLSNEGILSRTNPVLDILHSIPCTNEQSMVGSRIPVLINKTSSISSELPSSSFQPALNSQDVSLLQKIVSSLNKNSTPLPEMQDNRLPIPNALRTTWDSNQFNLPCEMDESTVRQKNIQNNLPVNASFRSILPSESLDPRKAARINSISNVSLVNHLDPSFNSCIKTLNSPPFTASLNYTGQVLSQTTRKASCLVPQHLKSLVGHETIETSNVRLLMLEWSVDWLMQQQQLKDPPPISNALKKVASSYESFEDYYNTYFPLLLLDTWHRIFVSWTHLNQTSPYLCQINSYSVKSHYVSVECHTIFNTCTHPKGVFPDEGSILMVKYSTKSNEYTIKILGYVTQVKTKRYNPVTDSKLLSNLRIPKDVKPEFLQVLTLTFMGAYNSEDIDKREPVSIHVLCNVKPTLKQNDALLYINESPLKRSILNPVADGLRSLTLTPRNSPSEKINECVRDITKGILSPHPLPLLTVVRAKPESDRLNIIPLLIEKMKNSYKTKVLLCVRTVRALGDIAANICLNQSLKLVIVNKRCDTNSQFQKYLLDEIVAAEIRKTEEDKPGEKVHVKNEMFIKMKKQILTDCDVVLSLVRNSHDEFLGETFTEKECIPQMCCIVDEANLCTEPETLIPILHGISKLILIGDPDYTAKVLSKTAASYNYSQSFFQRAYFLDLLED